jgi:hypothetical protein
MTHDGSFYRLARVAAGGEEIVIQGRQKKRHIVIGEQGGSLTSFNSTDCRFSDFLLGERRR